VDFNASGVRRVGFAYAQNVALAGWAWSVSSHGIAQSVNALNPMNLSIGVPDALHARHVAAARSLDDAAHRACIAPLAGGQHFNLGSIHEPGRQLMIEASNRGCVVRTLSPPSPLERRRRGLDDHGDHDGGVQANDEVDVQVTVGFHANLYESDKLKGIDGGAKALDSASSIHRYARMSQMAPATSIRALEAVVSDTQDLHYPIHRDGAKPDMYMTLNSVLFDVRAMQILVWGTEAPTRAARPTLRIDWRTLDLVLALESVQGLGRQTH
jgi:hypothetical protein